MRKRTIFCTALLSAVLILAGFTSAIASHPDVTLLDRNGSSVTSGTPYSPKATCAGCHIGNCTPTNAIPTNTMKWCETNDQRTALGKTDDYGIGDAFSTHVQGVLDSTNTVYWQAYQNKSFAHGASAGRHMNEGRNEDYSNGTRAAVGDPFFTSSLGMFGKY